MEPVVKHRHYGKCLTCPNTLSSNPMPDSVVTPICPMRKVSLWEGPFLVQGPTAGKSRERSPPAPHDLVVSDQVDHTAQITRTTARGCRAKRLQEIRHANIPHQARDMARSQ